MPLYPRVRLRQSVRDFMARHPAVQGSTDSDCDTVYKQFGGKPVGVATAEGFFSGLAGLVGASAFFQPVDSSVISKLTDGFDTLKDKWQTILNTYENKLTTTQMQFHQRQLDLLEAIDTFHTEILQESIQTNSLFITILFLTMLLVIAYLAFL